MVCVKEYCKPKAFIMLTGNFPFEVKCMNVTYKFQILFEHRKLAQKKKKKSGNNFFGNKNCKPYTAIQGGTNQIAHEEINV